VASGGSDPREGGKFDYAYDFAHGDRMTKDCFLLARTVCRLPNGSYRPFAALQDWPYERAESARKRSSLKVWVAQGAGVPEPNAKAIHIIRAQIFVSTNMPSSRFELQPLQEACEKSLPYDFARAKHRLR
jgi:hypothetical protein